MPAVRHCSRIDTLNLKVEMERRLGSQNAEKYFNLLTRFLSLKLEKSEFDKLCIRLIGRENLRHHNELIKAIIINATVSKTPPPKQGKSDPPLHLKDSNSNGIDPRNGLQSLCRDAFPQSPRKGRTPNLRERKFKDRPSPLGLNDKTHNNIAEDLATPRVQQQQNALSPAIYRRIPVSAPFGVSIHSKEKRKVACRGSDSAHYNGQLPLKTSLESILKQKLKPEGLDISTDCINLLSNGLESFLKRVIKPSVELACSRSIHTPQTTFTTSMMDFQMATETNPKMLGEDWPTQLEKIGLFAHEKSTAFEEFKQQ